MIARAKNKNNPKQWIEGHHCKLKNRHYIIKPCATIGVSTDSYWVVGMIEVIPETVCRCVCITDKNKKIIYEKDVLNPNLREVLFIKEGEGHIGVGFYTICHTANRGIARIPWSFGKTQAEESEIIGNIIDSPALTKVKT